MAEEKIDNMAPTTDDMSVLRVLLHNIKGISPISTTEGFMSVDVVDDDPITEN